MNIHFNDEKLLQQLKKNTSNRFLVGSHMYGLETKDSDFDYLNIYLENDQNRHSFQWMHHQLQYKEVNIDYNFTSLQGFIRNILTGDATINFELIFSNQMRDSSLNWLWEMRNSFINYNIIRSYLGMARRDLKVWRKETRNGIAHTTETNKKLSHFVRGIIFASMLLDGNFMVNMKNTNFHEKWVLLQSIKANEVVNYLSLIGKYEQEMKELRTALNEKSDAREIVKYMEVQKMKELDSKLFDYISTYAGLAFIDYGNLFYNALEYGISY